LGLKPNSSVIVLACCLRSSPSPRVGFEPVVYFRQTDRLDVPIKCHYGIIDIQKENYSNGIAKMVSGVSKQLKVEKTRVR